MEGKSDIKIDKVSEIHAARYKIELDVYVNDEKNFLQDPQAVMQKILEQGSFLVPSVKAKKIGEDKIVEYDIAFGFESQNQDSSMENSEEEIKKQFLEQTGFQIRKLRTDARQIRGRYCHIESGEFYCEMAKCPTPTPTPSPDPSPSPTPTPTPTPSPTPTPAPVGKEEKT